MESELENDESQTPKKGNRKKKSDIQSGNDKASKKQT